MNTAIEHFSEETMQRFQHELNKYPDDQKQSAVIACLSILQQENGFVTPEQEKALAAVLEIDTSALRETVDRFNGFVAKNHDDDFNRGDRAYDRWLGDTFHKKNASLGEISEGPFYAVPVLPGDVGTYGGVVTDPQARVLREDGSVIEGLYATGISTASVMGRVYPGAGASVGPSFVWGYVAAKDAVGAK